MSKKLIHLGLLLILTAAALAVGVRPPKPVAGPPATKWASSSAVTSAAPRRMGWSAASLLARLEGVAGRTKDLKDTKDFKDTKNIAGTRISSPCSPWCPFRPLFPMAP